MGEARERHKALVAKLRARVTPEGGAPDDAMATFKQLSSELVRGGASADEYLQAFLLLFGKTGAAPLLLELAALLPDGAAAQQSAFCAALQRQWGLPPDAAPAASAAAPAAAPFTGVWGGRGQGVAPKLAPPPPKPKKVLTLPKKAAKAPASVVDAPPPLPPPPREEETVTAAPPRASSGSSAAAAAAAQFFDDEGSASSVAAKYRAAAQPSAARGKRR